MGQSVSNLLSDEQFSKFASCIVSNFYLRTLLRLGHCWILKLTSFRTLVDLSKFDLNVDSNLSDDMTVEIIH